MQQTPQQRSLAHYTAMAAHAQALHELEAARRRIVDWHGLPAWIRAHRNEWTPEQMRSVIEALAGAIMDIEISDLDGVVKHLDAAADACDGLGGMTEQEEREAREMAQAERRRDEMRDERDAERG
jgi:hypothetical protein